MNETNKTQKVHRRLIVVDGVINLLLGVLILMFPFGVAELLGLPKPVTYFYTSILGAVLFGIGAALIVEHFGVARNIRGLGLGGAIAINFCGAGALLTWLLTGTPADSTRGAMVLWAVALIVLAVGAAEIVHLYRRRRQEKGN